MFFVSRLEKISLQTLLSKLVGQRHYYLALQASSFIRVSSNIGSSRILSHWAKFKVSIQKDFFFKHWQLWTLAVIWMMGVIL